MKLQGDSETARPLQHCTAAGYDQTSPILRYKQKYLSMGFRTCQLRDLRVGLPDQCCRQTLTILYNYTRVQIRKSIAYSPSIQLYHHFS